MVLVLWAPAPAAARAQAPARGVRAAVSDSESVEAQRTGHGARAVTVPGCLCQTASGTALRLPQHLWAAATVTKKRGPRLGMVQYFTEELYGAHGVEPCVSEP